MSLSTRYLFFQTNNGQEGFNNIIKRDFTLRERLPLNEFKMEFLNIVSTISSRYDPVKMKVEGRQIKRIIDIPVISNEQYREAHEWTLAQGMVIVENLSDNANFRCFLSPTPKFIDATAAKLIDLHKKNDFNSFDDYQKNGHKMIYETKICLTNCFLESTCICGDFTANFMCKHIIGFALQLKLKTCPKEGNSQPICAKKKAGRPSRAKKALVRQN